MTKKVLIAGASGLIGNELSEILLQRGYDVSLLTRKINNQIKIEQYLWNPAILNADENAFKGVDVIVNLAGASIADKKWTNARKSEILNSRVNAVKTIAKYINNIKGIHLINASAIGYYGFADNKKVFVEQDSPGSGFMAKVCCEWEKAVGNISTTDLNKSIVRIGVVLSSKGGALPKITKPIQLGLGTPLGTGNQIVSWIHMDDLISIFLMLIEGRLPAGIYNGVAPNPLNNKQLTYEIAKRLNKRIIWPSVPEFVLKIMLGEMADVVLKGNIVSSEKLISNDFQFKFPEIQGALSNLINR